MSAFVNSTKKRLFQAALLLFLGTAALLGAGAVDETCNIGALIIRIGSLKGSVRVTIRDL